MLGSNEYKVIFSGDFLECSSALFLSVKSHMLHLLVKLSIPLTFARKPHLCGPTQNSILTCREMLNVIKHARNSVLVLLVNFYFCLFL